LLNNLLRTEKAPAILLTGDDGSSGWPGASADSRLAPETDDAVVDLVATILKDDDPCDQ
jgi:hypothetical protein